MNESGQKRQFLDMGYLEDYGYIYRDNGMGHQNKMSKTCFIKSCKMKMSSKVLYSRQLEFLLYKLGKEITSDSLVGWKI